MQAVIMSRNEVESRSSIAHASADESQTVSMIRTCMH